MEPATMPLDFGLVLYPWDFNAAAGSVLDRVVGEVGLDHLTVPVVTGPRTHLRVGPGYDTPLFHTEGGFHFQPDRPRYAASGLRPPVARWLSKREPLAPLGEYCQEHGLDLLLRVDARGLRALTEQNPDLRPRAAWGDEIPDAPPCVFHPAYREFVETTLHDLRRYAPAGLQLAGLDVEVPLAAVAQAHLGVTFSTAARQVARRAGVDVAAAEAQVRDRLAALWSGSAGPLTASESAAGDYLAALEADVRAWLEGVGGSLGEVRRYVLEAAWLGAGRVEGWRSLSGASLVGHEALPRAERERLFGNLHGLSTSLAVQQSDELVRCLHDLCALGLCFFEFSGIESRPETDIKRLKQAVRYARREAGGSA